MKAELKEVLASQPLTPMEAVNALYVDEHEEVPEAIIASLSDAIFDGEVPRTASGLKRRLARPVTRLLRRTTRTETRTEEDGTETTVYRNRILERSGHPYAETLLSPSHSNAANFVEGGDPMNGPYMMISPEIRKNAKLWDKILLDSVLGRDVQIRFIHETKFALEAAKARLKESHPVRLKGTAAGTGLSMILVYDRLMKEGVDPRHVSVTITDRDPANVAKAARLIERLESTRDRRVAPGEAGIAAQEEDMLEPGDGDPHDVVTMVGILEYFGGHALPGSEAGGGDGPDASDAVRAVASTVSETGQIIANSYRPETGAKIILIFGKKIFFRDAGKLRALMESAGFTPHGRSGSGVVYDVEAFAKGG